MRESFVIYTEWVEDLPEEYKGPFLAYIYQYGAHGESPNLTGLELALWVKIQRRMDADAEKWQETKDRRSAAGRAGGIKSAEVRKALSADAGEAEEKPERLDQIVRALSIAPEKPKEKKVSNFVKPTIEEIKAYCELRKNRVNAEQFFNFYESKGWKVGRSNMKNWKAAVVTWEQRSQTPRPIYNNSSAGPPAERIIF